MYTRSNVLVLFALGFALSIFGLVKHFALGLASLVSVLEQALR